MNTWLRMTVTIGFILSTCFSTSHQSSAAVTNSGSVQVLSAEACANAKFVIPASGELGWVYRTTIPEEWRTSPELDTHTGIDIYGEMGDPIYAAFDGVVGPFTTLPNGTRSAVSIIHQDLNVKTYYAHLSQFLVNTGDLVTRGQLIGYMGNTGCITTTFANIHLHFSVSKIGESEQYIQNTYDPSSFLGAELNALNGVPAWDDRTVLGQCYEVAVTNISVAVVIDATGSMQSNDPDDDRLTAAKAFIDSTKYGDRIAVVSFNTVANHLAPLRTIRSQSDRDYLKSMVDTIGSSGQTNLNAGLDGGYQELLSDATDNSKAAIFLTDGMQECGEPYYPESHLQYQRKGWSIYTIGLGSSVDASLLRRVASETGGTYHFLMSPQDLQDVYIEIARAIEGGALLHNSTTVISQGSTADYEINISSGQHVAIFYTGWLGSEVSAQLTTPSGQLITPITSDVNIQHAKSSTYELYTVYYPAAGTWGVQLYGTDIPAGGEDVSLQVYSVGIKRIYLPVVARNWDSSTPAPIVQNTSPNVPSTPAPVDGTLDASTELILEWQGGDPDGDTVYYDVYLEHGDSTPDIRVATRLRHPTFLATALVPTAEYYWQIIARDEYGVSTVGPIWRFTTGSVSVIPAGMALVPAGMFQMGCDGTRPGERCRSDELPLHSIYLDTYLIDYYEVSNDQYAECVLAGACTPPSSNASETRPDYYSNPTYADYPVVYVDWHQASAYCTWQDKRLPTEAEWEKAARGISDTRIFPWGDTAPDCTRANYNWCVGDTTAVTSYSTGASPYGSLNMSGNVWEWVNDWYQADYYLESPAANPSGPPSGVTKVIRGGSYGDNISDQLRVALRDGINQSWYQLKYIGFRCAKTPVATITSSGAPPYTP